MSVHSRRTHQAPGDNGHETSSQPGQESPSSCGSESQPVEDRASHGAERISSSIRAASSIPGDGWRTPPACDRETAPGSQLTQPYSSDLASSAAHGDMSSNPPPAIYRAGSRHPIDRDS